MSAFNYRHEAKKQVAKARELLETSDDEVLRYACLELRMALEMVIYDLLRAYCKRSPDLADLAHWQPRPVLKALIEVDPFADRSPTINYARQGKDHSHGPMKTLGTDNRLRLRDAAKYHHALSNFLHAPVLARVEAGEVTEPTTIRRKCYEVLEDLERVLTSQIWNAVLLDGRTFECECGVKICRTLDNPAKPGELFLKELTCRSCGLSWLVKIGSATGEPRFRKKYASGPCPNCSGTLALPNNQAKDGAHVSCKCGATFKLVEALSLEPIEELCDENM